ncbi:MAG: RNA methyltransferase [Acidimicrobiia bacterium]|nr:RNA methyltransferase [Acidimicrobiia bacterium]NNC74411.1 RNA methyltransferase [Acidimicrobiia bacterium]
MSAITSPRNPRVVEAAKLHEAKHRRRQGRTLVEGPGALEVAMESGADVIEVFSLGEAPGATQVDRSVLARLSGTETPRGPIAIVAIPTDDDPRPADSVVLWEISDPGNVGALIRTAAFLGFDVVAHGGADIWSPKAIRSAAGAQFAVHVSRVDSIEDLPAESTVAAVVDGGSAPGPVPRPVAILLGNEAAGLPEAVATAATHRVTIPGQFESLNVAVAGSLLMDRLLR